MSYDFGSAAATLPAIRMAARARLAFHYVVMADFHGLKGRAKLTDFTVYTGTVDLARDNALRVTKPLTDVPLQRARPSRSPAVPVQGRICTIYAIDALSTTLS